MRFDRIAALFAATTSQIVMPYSPSSRDPHGEGQLGQAFAGEMESLRLSASLQDLSACRNMDLEEGGIGDGPGYTRSDSELDLLGRPAAAASGGPSKVKVKTKGGSSPPASRFPWKKLARKAVLGTSIVLLLALIYFCILHFTGSWSHNSANYYVILDCGSTGTRVYVYEWTVNKKRHTNGLPIALRSLPKHSKWKLRRKSGRAYQRMETEPGFDKLVRNETGLRTAMTPLLRWAEKQIPKRAHVSTSVFLYATAGVRRLPKPDSDWLLDKAWGILKDSSAFSSSKDRVKIISGMEEAYYGWIALNHHMGNLGAIPAKETFGALDLGGSSLQVTFETEQMIQDDSALRLKIGSVNHHLSAYSLPGYGLNDAFDRAVAILLRKRHPRLADDLRRRKIVLKHPCLQTGYKEHYVCSQCAALLPKDGIPPIRSRSTTAGKGQNGITIELRGAPHWEECNALAKAAVNLSEWSNTTTAIDCDVRPCALDDSLPRPQGQFYAMSGFFVVYRFFNLSSEVTLEEMLQKGQKFCEKKWEVAKKSVAPQPFIEQYCFRAPYVSMLLKYGLHIRDGQVVIGAGSVTWTLGVVLIEAGQELSGRVDFHDYRMFPRNVSFEFVAVLVVAPIFLFGLVSFACKLLHRFFRRTYLPIRRHNITSNGSILNFRHWSPIISDDREKMPLSPTVSGSAQHPFRMENGLTGGNGQSSRSSATSILRSYSGGFSQTSLTSGIGHFWPHRSQMQLWRKRSLSREDLRSTQVEVHTLKS